MGNILDLILPTYIELCKIGKDGHSGACGFNKKSNELLTELENQVIAHYNLDVVDRWSFFFMEGTTIGWHTDGCIKNTDGKFVSTFPTSTEIGLYKNGKPIIILDQDDYKILNFKIASERAQRKNKRINELKQQNKIVTFTPELGDFYFWPNGLLHKAGKNEHLPRLLLRMSGKSK